MGRASGLGCVVAGRSPASELVARVFSLASGGIHAQLPVWAGIFKGAFGEFGVLPGYDWGELT